MNLRDFEKIKFEQFRIDIDEDQQLYEEYLLPKRSTKNSAAYDFFAIRDFTLQPGEILQIPTGYKCRMQPNEVLLLLVRSSQGFKYNIRMCNQVGVIDSDYYNNTTNEGHFWVALQNEGTKEYNVKKGEAYAQGMFINYLITDSDESDGIRTGGLGSTNRGEDEK